MSCPQGYPLTSQSVAYTGTHGAISNAVGDHINRVRIVCTTSAFIQIAGTPVATTADVYVPGEREQIFTIKPGQKVSAIQHTSGGSLYVTEMTE